MFSVVCVLGEVLVRLVASGRPALWAGPSLPACLPACQPAACLPGVPLPPSLPTLHDPAPPACAAPAPLLQMSELGLQGGVQPLDPHLQAALQQMAVQQMAAAAGGGTAVGEPAPGDHAHAHAHAHAHGDGHGGGGVAVAEGQPDPHHHHQQLPQMGMDLSHLDHATLAAMAAAGMAAEHHPHHGGAAGLTLPMVHTVEVPAPLEDHHQDHHQDHHRSMQGQ